MPTRKPTRALIKTYTNRRGQSWTTKIVNMMSGKTVTAQSRGLEESMQKAHEKAGKK